MRCNRAVDCPDERDEAGCPACSDREIEQICDDVCGGGNPARPAGCEDIQCDCPEPECDFDRDCADGQRCENRQCEVCECEPAGQNQEVCGSDGQTYNSPCLARCARIDVVANGACEPVVECPPEDDSCAFVCRGLRPPLPEGCVQPPSCHCPEPSCANTEIECNDGTCIDVALQCNQVDNCSEGEDEVGCAFECQNGEVECLNNIRRTCVGGTWENIEDCMNFDCRVVGDDTACIDPNPPVCEADETRCENNVFERCEGGQWQIGEDCKDFVCRNIPDQGFGCVNPDDIGCADGFRRCDLENNRRQVCREDMWVVEEECNGDTECRFIDATTTECFDPNAAVCQDGQEQCNGDRPEVCVNGQWAPGVACAEGFVCQESQPGVTECVEFAGCDAGTERCNARGQRERCTDNSWTFLAECPNGLTCTVLDDGRSDCIVVAVCANGEQRCEQNWREECVDGQWVQQSFAETNAAN